MKTTILYALALLLAAGMIGCAANDVSSRMTYYHGQTIPDLFFKVLNWSPDTLKIEIRVDFRSVHMYHIILDESDKPLAEGWYPTTLIGQAYSVILKAKKGAAFQAGKHYRLCIGIQNPEEVSYTTNNYKCVSDYEFVLK